jgi:hypothetical protein
MAIIFVTNLRSIDWLQAVVSIILSAIGISMLIAPIKVSQILALLNRSTPGELLPYNRPQLVAQSRSMRLSIRLLGALFLGAGVSLFVQVFIA